MQHLHSIFVIHIFIHSVNGLCCCYCCCSSCCIFIARQHAVHAERDIVLSILSVCLSVQCQYSLSLSLSVLTAIFQVNLDKPVFIEAKDDGSGGDTWSNNSCKAPVKSSPPTNHHLVFLQAGCPSCRPSNSASTVYKSILSQFLTIWQGHHSRF